jgi:LmbE family N-acetylglucosaminyl deacetylase
MVTTFASEVLDEMVGEFASWKHARWGVTSADEVLEVRRREDQAAANELGARVRWLGLPDAIYRGERYQQDAELFGELVPDELALAAHLAEELVGLPEWVDGTRVFVPLGVGNHVDHQLVFEAGRALAARGVEVYAYEDTPYAIHTPAGVAARLARVGDAVGEPVLVPIGKQLERRIAAIARYETQVPVIFRFTADFAGAIRDHARSVGGALGPAERYWPVKGG